MSHWNKNYDRKQKYYNARVAGIVEGVTYTRPEEVPVPDNPETEKDEKEVEDEIEPVWDKGDIQRD